MNNRGLKLLEYMRKLLMVEVILYSLVIAWFYSKEMKPSILYASLAILLSSAQLLVFHKKGWGARSLFLFCFMRFFHFQIILGEVFQSISLNEHLVIKPMTTLLCAELYVLVYSSFLLLFKSDELCKVE